MAIFGATTFAAGLAAARADFAGLAAFTGLVAFADLAGFRDLVAFFGLDALLGFAAGFFVAFLAFADFFAAFFFAMSNPHHARKMREALETVLAARGRELVVNGERRFGGKRRECLKNALPIDGSDIDRMCNRVKIEALG
ncbi:MAG: hypothetical protein JNG88_15095 [Phycisphaerales bacterium]|nr:hypothetical protein [Phycisphaerales bacterium]